MEPNSNQQETGPTRSRWVKVVSASAILLTFIAAASADYEVKSGDTLNQIAAELGVSKAELIAVNGISDPDLIRTGQILIVPGQNRSHSDNSHRLRRRNSGGNRRKVRHHC